MEDNTYITDKLYQKLYQLNVIHDMDHDFSTTKFADRLAKIGKRIHKTALALFPQLQGQGQGQGGGSQGGNRQDWLRQNNAIRNKDFVSLFSSIKLKNLNGVERSIVTGENNQELVLDTIATQNNPRGEAAKNLIKCLLITDRNYNYDLFNTGVSFQRQEYKNDGYKEEMLYMSV